VSPEELAHRRLRRHTVVMLATVCAMAIAGPVPIYLYLLLDPRWQATTGTGRLVGSAIASTILLSALYGIVQGCRRALRTFTRMRYRGRHVHRRALVTQVADASPDRLDLADTIDLNEVHAGHQLSLPYRFTPVRQVRDARSYGETPRSDPPAAYPAATYPGDHPYSSIAAPRGAPPEPADRPYGAVRGGPYLQPYQGTSGIHPRLTDDPAGPDADEQPPRLSGYPRGPQLRPRPGRRGLVDLTRPIRPRRPDPRPGQPSGGAPG
jgi:hypothetical protein